MKEDPTREKLGAKIIVSAEKSDSFLPNPQEMLKEAMAETAAKLITHILEEKPETITGAYEIRVEITPMA